MHILIVKLGSIGDIVHTLPSLAAIRNELADAEISWVVEERSAEILRGNPMLDNLIEVDTRSLRGGKIIEEILLDVTKQIKGLRRYSFEIAVDYQGLLKSAMIAKLSGARKRWGFARRALREPASRFVMTDAADIPSRIHVIRKNLMLTAKALDIEVPDSDFGFPIAASHEHVGEANQIIAKTSGRFALLNPAGGWVTKLWSSAKFGQLAERLWEEKGLESIVVTAPNEIELAETVSKNCRTNRLHIAQPSLKGFYELARRASVYIGGDTGPTHIAVAAGAPIVGLFGPTEWWRNGSPYADDICVERNDIGCRVDCHRRTCSNWICMDTDVATVFDAVVERLRIAQSERFEFRS